MPQKYAVVDGNGFPLAYYDEGIHGSRLVSIPDPDYVVPELNDGDEIPVVPRIVVDNPSTLIPVEAIEISDAQWMELIENNGRRKLVDGSLVTFDPPINPNAEILNQIATLEINVTARRIREAVLGTDGGWLAALEDEIEDLRAQLV